MNIAGLIEVLQTYDPELDVVVAKDAEGNGFSELSAVSLEQFDLQEFEPVSEDGDWSPNCIVLWRV